MGRLLRRAAIFIAPIIINKVVQKFLHKDDKSSSKGKKRK
ncbi:hypothetical protein GCM10007275_18990 [Jeotgalicoccus coquinae]|uniref:Uncharacterized protein n=1 Tax=Jeotgalicoccus coquinae TaxID=709509 RepID=A0A6V7RQA8_9STAP|nr:hypothetical protein [Jeotgalicoccus coquinae]GGE24103.1 hypothetical protein GCM10007275_18990 [Jeotgalicoccus coquinae]CAD2080539.1 hypothetical protein JEOCOQ751_01766 [Jeotgalicoccus coquinae]